MQTALRRGERNVIGGSRHRLDRTDIDDGTWRRRARFIVEAFDELLCHRLIDQKGTANIGGDDAVEIIFGGFKKRR